MKKLRNDYLLIWAFGVLLTYITYAFVQVELPGVFSDYNGHTYVYYLLFTKETWVEGWKAAPYCLWHLTTMLFHRGFRLPLDTAAGVSACVYTDLAYLVFCWIIQKFTDWLGYEESYARTGFLSFGFCILQPISCFWLQTGDRILGNFSMNPLHNPTYICMRGFSMLCICLVTDIWGAQKNPEYRGIFFKVESGLRKYYWILTGILFLSTMAKPTFAEMYIPAVGIVMLAEWGKRMRDRNGSAARYFLHIRNTFLCAIPSLLYILAQYLAYFVFDGSYIGESSVIITELFEVWRLYSQNVILSIVLGMAFPLFMILIDSHFFTHHDWGKLALAGYLVGLLEAAFLGEEGIKFSFCNFIWPMMSGMMLMFMVALLRLLELERTQTETKGKRILIAAAWMIFCVHVWSGVSMIWNSLQTGLPQ